MDDLLSQMREFQHWMMEQSCIAARAAVISTDYQSGKEDAFDLAIHRLEKILNGLPHSAGASPDAKG